MKKPARKRATPRLDKLDPSLPRRKAQVWITCIVLSAAAMAGAAWWKSSGRHGTTARLRTVPSGPLTFNRDIAPILHDHCAVCHRPGEAAPFNLLTYHDVRQRAADVVTVTARRYMPPWPPEPGPPFADERRLTDAEIEIIRRWVAEGAPEGPVSTDASDRLSAAQWPNGWQLGEPDLVVQMPEAYTLAAAGHDVYRNFVIPMSVTSRRYVRAVEFKADTRVLHHVFIRLDRSQQSRRLDAQDSEVGFPGMALPPSVESAGGHFLSWQPGRGPTQFPDGLAWALEPGRDLVLQAHLQPSGKPEKVRPRIGFYFTDQAPTNTPVKLVLSSLDIDLPPGSTNRVITDQYQLPADVDLLAVLPHAHYLARDIEGRATLPSGQVVPLIHIKDWDFNWQSDYRYTAPLFLPKGTHLDLRVTYDNSTNNVRNPHKPPVRVTYGLQSTDEMAELWLQVIPRSPDDRRALETDWQRRALAETMKYHSIVLRRDPTNAHSHVQLAKALILVGQPAQAWEHLRQGVRFDPRSEEGHYHLGVLLMDQDFAAAEREFLETLRTNPENFKALNNLGLVLLRQGRLPEAEVQFKAALDRNPGDRLILDNLELVRRNLR